MPIYNDVRTLTADVLARDGIAVDVITGGFPCQDLSVAGKQRGMGEGTRSGLWSEIVRLIGELRPRYVIVENVAALLSGPSNQRGGWFGRILGDLAECGYDAEWENIPASALGDPHRRERVWIVAYPNGDGLEAKPAKAVLFDEAGDSRLPGRLSQMDSQKIWIGTRPIGAVPMAMGDGVSEWLGDIKGAGNAVVPQIPELIGRAIMAAEGITASAGIAAGAFPVEGGASAHDAAALFSPCETPGAAVPGFFSLQKRLMP